MKPTDKAEQPNQDTALSDEFEGFVKLFENLVAVPKSEIRREAEEWERARADHRSA